MRTVNSTENTSIEIAALEDTTLNELLSDRYSASKVVIIVDENTHDYCLEYLLTTFDSLKEAEVMLLPVGEENKVMEVCFQVWEALSEYNIGRSDLIINLGGGVVTDMGGFIASIYKRGVDFIHIPTSLLAMVDAAIGGKTGIDLGMYKNQLGVFNHPQKIVIDPAFLQTLPENELLNGYAEMLKHALIKSKAHWEELKQITTLQALTQLNIITASIEIKQAITEADPFEQSIRKALNFGHTIGHAIEGYMLDKTPISHGYAVANGMLAETYLSMKKGMLSKPEFAEIEFILTEIFPVLPIDSSEFPAIIHVMKNDKKNTGSTINCSLLTGIGECEINCFVTEEEVVDALNYIQKFVVRHQ